MHHRQVRMDRDTCAMRVRLPDQKMHKVHLPDQKMLKVHLPNQKTLKVYRPDQKMQGLMRAKNRLLLDYCCLVPPTPTEALVELYQTEALQLMVVQVAQQPTTLG